MQYYVDKLRAFIKLVNANNPVLIGHSMGGLAAIHLATEDAARETKALVLEDSAGLGGGPDFKMRMAFLSYMLRMSLLGANENRVRGWLKKGFYDDPSKISDESVKRALNSWKDSSYRRLQRKTAMGLRQDEGKASGFIDQISVPTLIIWGEKDRQIPAEVAYHAAERIKNCKVEVIPNCGHAPHGECSEEFNTRVLAFLDGLG
jgi:pimeloyl-ACP methyl ester carboxylesterase